MHIMTDSSDLNDVDSADERPPNPSVKSKAQRSHCVPKDAPDRARSGSVDSSNDVRLEEDQPTGEGADEGAIESSEDEDEEDGKSSDDEDESTPDRKRGRGRSRADKESNAAGEDSEESEDDPYAALYGQNKSTRQAKSALAAAEDERELA